MGERKISRRTFISTTTMAGLAMALDCGKINALAAKIRTKKDLPIVVIGAGLGGLCCGGLLAKRGFPVTVVEQHDILGGYSTTFDRAAGKFTFDVSLRRISASSETRRLLRELGVWIRSSLYEKDKWLRDQPIHVCHLVWIGPKNT